MCSMKALHASLAQDEGNYAGTDAKSSISVTEATAHCVSDGCEGVESQAARRTQVDKVLLSFTMRLLGPRVLCVLTSSPQPHRVVLGSPVEITVALSLKEARNGILEAQGEFLYSVLNEKEWTLQAPAWACDIGI